MLHKTSTSSSPTKTRNYGARPRLSPDAQAEALPRKSKPHGYAPKRWNPSRLDVWLSSFTPTALRPCFLSVPTLPTLVMGFCLFSVSAFSSYLYICVSTLLANSPPLRSDSVLESLPMDHLFAKMSSIRPPPVLLNPNALSTPPGTTVFSACLWTVDVEVDFIENWAAEWRGPVSLLVTTTAAPESPQHREMVNKLAALQRKHPPLRQTFFVHLLHLDPATDVHPNAFLNIARLLAPSPRVVLFPGNLSSAPPKTLYRTLLHQQPYSSSAMTSSGRTRGRRPAVLTDGERTSFPFVPLAPLVLARDDSTWCTERFFAGMSRAADWEECLWQVWLANFGDLEIRQVPGISPNGGDTTENASTVRKLPLSSRFSQRGGVFQAKLHRRLVSKFKSETCGLAIRRFAALRDPNSSADTKKARWLKRVCRSYLN
ncbi:hypothetical protein OH77DRAFT_1589227 [Trametes cingulata]|nr:hypothetical protein OH77DRAFT_1589227 [Trametes cingulata]